MGGFNTNKTTNIKFSKNVSLRSKKVIIVHDHVPVFSVSWFQCLCSRDSKTDK